MNQATLLALRPSNLTATKPSILCKTALFCTSAERGPQSIHPPLSPAHVPSRTRRGASAHSCDALVDHRGDKSTVSIDQHRGSATATSNGDAKRCILSGARRRHGNCFSWWIAAHVLCDRGTDRWLAWLPRGDGTVGTGRPCRRAKNWRLSCRNSSFAGRIRSGASGAFAAFGP